MIAQPTAYSLQPTAFHVFGGCQMDPACLGSGECEITWGGRILAVCLHHAHFADGPRAPKPIEQEALARRAPMPMQPGRRVAPPPREPVDPQPPELVRFCSRCGKTRIYACNLSGVCTPCQRVPGLRAMPRYAVCAVCARTYRVWSRSFADMCKPCTGRLGQHNLWRHKHGFARLAREEWMRLKRQHANLRLQARTTAYSPQPTAHAQ